MGGDCSLLKGGRCLLKSYFNKLKIFFYSGHQLANKNSYDYMKKTILFGINSDDVLKDKFKRNSLVMGDVFIDSKSNVLYVVNLINKEKDLNKTVFEGLNLLIINLKEKQTYELMFNQIKENIFDDDINYLGNMMLYKSSIDFVHNKVKVNKSVIHDELYYIHESILEKKSMLSIYTINNKKEKQFSIYKLKQLERLYIKEFYSFENLIDKHGYSLLIKTNAKDKKEFSLLTDSVIVNDDVTFTGINHYGIPSCYREKTEITDVTNINNNGLLYHYLDNFFEKEKENTKKSSYIHYLLMYIS